MFNRSEKGKNETFLGLLKQEVSWKSISSVLKHEIHITVQHEYPQCKQKKDRNIRRMEVEIEAAKYKLEMLNAIIHEELELDHVKKVQIHADYRKYLQDKIKELQKKIKLHEEAA